MKIKSIQKVIKVGSSLAVTIPARDAKAAGITAGSEVEFEAQILDIDKNVDRNIQIAEDYAAFAAQYSETLKNLSQR